MHACRLRGRQQKRRERHRTTVSHSQQSRGKWCSNLLLYMKSRLQLASSLHFLACPPSVCYPLKCSLDLYWSAIEMDVLAVFQKTNQKKRYYFRSKEPFEAFFLPLMCTCIANKTDHEIHLVWRRLAVGLGGVGANGDFVRSASSLRSFPDQGHMSAVEEKGGEGNDGSLSLPFSPSLYLRPLFPRNIRVE